MPSRASKLISLQEAAALIPDGCTVAVGGLSYFGAPMALVRELVRRKIRGLTLVTAAVTSIQADLLIAAGAVQKIVSPYVAFEELGLAPNFRRAAEQQQIEIVEVGEAFLGYALKAAAAGAPFAALPLRIAASDCARVNPLYRVVRDPFSNEEVLCVPALRPDWTLVHAQRADEFGNLAYEGPSFMDGLLVRAAKSVLATVDELVPHDPGRRRPAAASTPAFLVHGFVVQRGAARPTASFGEYGVDRKELKRYATASKTAGTLSAYLAEFGADDAAYLQQLGSPPLAAEAAPADAQRDLTAPPSKAEIIATVLCHSVRDGMFTGAGTGCWEVAAGLRLAQLTHAPNLVFTMGGSGAISPRLPYLPASLNSDEPVAECEGQVPLEELFDLELRGGFDVMFASAMQVDQYGNLNLVAVGPYEKPALRGPGTVGLEFTSCVPEIVIFLRSHSRQALVQKVDFVSGIGYGSGPGSRRRWGLIDSRGPRLVVTNLAVMDFDPTTLRMRLKSVHPGVTVEQVRENTGFELIVPSSVPPTPMPTAEEIRLLRTEIDRGGMLARLIP